MPAPVTTIRNLGPAMAARLARAGIEDAETLRALGADEAYRRMLAAGDRPHRMAYQALVTGLQGRPFHGLDPEEQARLAERFDALAQEAGRSADRAVEAALDALGVVPRRPRAPAARARRRG